MIEFAFVLMLGILVGGITAWVIGRSRAAADSGLAQQAAALLEKQLAEAKQELSAERQKVLLLNADLASSRTGQAGLQEKLDTQKAELEKVQQRLTTEFENIANRILDEKSQKFTEQNKANIGTILDPLQERIREFQKRVEESYTTESKERLSLEREVKRLAELNQQVSKDAADLTKALKGEAKTQGNWGEMILEKILERSGLREGQEFKVQESRDTEDGGRLRPDVVVYLPEGKNIVVDSKVSLTAYERFSSAGDAEEQAARLAEHVASVRAHIKGLCKKSYQKLYGINTPDFVLMFMPLEPAFSAALNADDQLFSEAFDQGIVLVSSTTLLTTLRTIANIWRQERQNRNVMEIARQAGDLYDKFVGFVEDLRKLGSQMLTAQKTYEEAMGKLSTGKGNIVRRVENLRVLGAPATKCLPASVLETSDQEEPAGKETTTQP